jgi:hypothetical protein
MSNSAQKFPLQVSLGNIAKKGANDAISLLGMSLPASVVSVSGAFVTVKFEILSDYSLPQITVPVLGSLYVREPLQAGDKGVLIPCDANIAGITGQDGSTADMTAPANLSGLMFMPIGNMNWKSVDPSMLTLTGLSDLMVRNNAHQLQLEDINTAWTTLISDINALLLIISPAINAAAQTVAGIPPVVLTPIPATVNPVKPRA